MTALAVHGGADLNRARHDGATAIHLAAHAGQAQLVTRLLALGADVDPRRQDGSTPLYTAAQRGQAEAIKVLIRKGGADPSQATQDGGERAFPSCTRPFD